ncbi:MAG: amidohydrolase family protein [Polyangiaceae bacterium]|nr:amidohydrolase family protein [Polyangiaceae bacterium]
MPGHHEHPSGHCPPVLDTHLHIWDLDRVQYPWLGPELGILYRTYTPSEIEPELEPARVDGAILVQAADDPADTELMLEACDAHPWIRGVVGWMPLADPGAMEAALARLRHDRRIVGVRHLIHTEPDPGWLARPAVIEGLRMLAAAGLPFDVVATQHAHRQAALAVAQQVPELRMVLDHFAGVPAWDAPAEVRQTFHDDMQALAAHPQISAKLSGLGTAIGKGPGWGAEDVRPVFEEVLALFGPRRILCGGDWPVCLLAGTYPHAMQTYRELIGALDPADRAALLRGNAERFYGLDEGRGRR